LDKIIVKKNSESLHESLKEYISSAKQSIFQDDKTLFFMFLKEI